MVGKMGGPTYRGLAEGGWVVNSKASLGTGGSMGPHQLVNICLWQWFKGRHRIDRTVGLWLRLWLVMVVKQRWAGETTGDPWPAPGRGACMAAIGKSARRSPHTGG